MSTERVIVLRGVEATLASELAAIFRQVKIGDAKNDPSAILNGLLTQSAAEGVLTMMKEAVARGADVMVGDLQRNGGVVQPHILGNVKPGMSLWDRESFGPGTYPVTRPRRSCPTSFFSRVIGGGEHH